MPDFDSLIAKGQFGLALPSECVSLNGPGFEDI
jgi:hypothetical protein